MDEILALQAALQAAQETKSAVRLSERNVIELVNKLKELGLLGDDLLYTTNGKEYLTVDRLRQELAVQVSRHGGRVSVLDAAALIGIDLSHAEKQAEALASSRPDMCLLQGELITDAYWDGMAAEIDESLQQSGQLPLAELARQFNVRAELMLSNVTSRLGTLIHGKLEGGRLYTEAYVAGLAAIVRGVMRASLTPITLASVTATVTQLDAEDCAMAVRGGSTPAATNKGGADGSSDGAGSGSADAASYAGIGSAISTTLIKGIVERLAAEGAIQGSLKGGGVTWVPAIFARRQKEAVQRFYERNGFIEYAALTKLQVPQPAKYLQQMYPADGVALPEVFASKRLLVPLEAGAEDAIDSSTWCAAMAFLPSGFSPADAAELCRHSSLLASASSKGQLRPFLSTFWVSEELLKAASARFTDMAAEAARAHVLRRAQNVVVHDASSSSMPGHGGGRDGGAQGGGGGEGGGKKGQEALDAAEEDVGGKGKGGKQRKGSSAGAKGGKGGKGRADVAEEGGAVTSSGNKKGRGDKDAGVNETSGLFTIKDMVRHLLEWYPEMEGLSGVPVEEDEAALYSRHDHDGDEDGGNDEVSLAYALAVHLRGAAVAAFVSAKKAALVAGAETRRKWQDALRGQMEALYQDLQLFAKGAELFRGSGGAAADTSASAGDAAGGGGAADAAQGVSASSVSLLLQRHLLRGIATTLWDVFLRSQSSEFEEDDAAATCGGDPAQLPPLAPSQRDAAVRGLSRPAAKCAAAVAEVLRAGRDVSEFLTAFDGVANECCVRLRALDKKAERAQAHANKKALLAQLEAETVPSVALALAVPLLFLQVHGRVIQVPGRALAGVVDALRGHVSAETHAFLSKYLTDVMAFLSSPVSSATYDAACAASGAGAEGGEADSGVRPLKREHLEQRLKEDLPALKALAQPPKAEGVGEASAPS
eukprot:jgi/Mesvir1/23513/Mv18219-RA.1